MENEIAKIFEDNPLIAFSPITDMQSQYLIKLGKELVDEMEKWTDKIENSQHVYYQYWLWVLGAYEVIRTMSGHNGKRKFKYKFRSKIFEYKTYIAEVRIPFAKQKVTTKQHEPEIRAFAEVMVRDYRKDMLFEIKGVRYSAKESIEKFEKLICSLKLSDINFS